MPELPAPATRSPGKLKLLYTSGVLPHEVGSNFNETVDITDIPTIRTEAGVLADLVKAMLPDTCTITGWKITNPAGVTLYEEVFTPAKVGTQPPIDGQLQSESASLAFTGKGAPTVGLKQGQTKFTVFPNFYIPVYWEGPNQPVTALAAWAPVRNHLNTSTVIGSDFYGSPGVWRAYVDTQINAHYQKRYGI